MGKKQVTEPIVEATGLAWCCPFCGCWNGIPEVTVCKCGAVASDGVCTLPGDVEAESAGVGGLPRGAKRDVAGDGGADPEDADE